MPEQGLEPDSRLRFVDTNVVNTLRTRPIFEFHRNSRSILLLLSALVIATASACEISAGEIEPTLVPLDAELICNDCELVHVNSVIDSNTVETSIGEIEMYGAYVVDQPADCAEEAEVRLRELSGSALRIKKGPIDSVRSQPNHYYLFTEEGESIEERLISEGLALAWTHDGEYLGWLIFLDAVARRDERGCLWHDYQAFQHGEPNEFRIPGLPDRAS